MKVGLTDGATRIVRISYDDVAPSLVDEAPVTLAGAVLTLTFDEALDTGSVPAGTDFTVTTGGGATEALADTTPVAVSGTTVTLTLAAAPAATAQELTVGYTAGTNPLRDPQQNDVEDFSETLSLNPPPTGKPSITGEARVGSTLTADISGIEDADGLTKARAGDTGFAFTYQWYETDGRGAEDCSARQHENLPDHSRKHRQDNQCQREFSPTTRAAPRARSTATRPPWWSP